MSSQELVTITVCVDNISPHERSCVETYAVSLSRRLYGKLPHELSQEEATGVGKHIAMQIHLDRDFLHWQAGLSTSSDIESSESPALASSVQSTQRVIVNVRVLTCGDGPSSRTVSMPAPSTINDVRRELGNEFGSRQMKHVDVFVDNQRLPADDDMRIPPDAFLRLEWRGGLKGGQDKVRSTC